MRKLTHEEFLDKFYKVNTHAQDIEILGTYNGHDNKIKCKCKIDGHEWEPPAKSLLRGRGCPICGIKTTQHKCTKTHEQFIDDLAQINKDIEVLGTYETGKTKIKCRCKIDGYIWEATPNNLLNGYGCPKCKITSVKEKCTKTHKQFIKELHEVNPDIKILGTYINGSTKILCKCNIDGHEWEAKPTTLLQGHGCPKCSISKGEKKVAQYLDSLNIEYIFNRCYFNDLVGLNGGLMRPDFIIPSLKIWIEYDGIQHFEAKSFNTKMSEQQVQEEYNRTVQNDQIKNQYAKANNWILVRIPYWDYDNIEQILAAYIEQEEQAI